MKPILQCIVPHVASTAGYAHFYAHFNELQSVMKSLFSDDYHVIFVARADGNPPMDIYASNTTVVNLTIDSNSDLRQVVKQLTEIAEDSGKEVPEDDSKS